MKELPSRKYWNTPHSPETAHDIVNEMPSRQRRRIAIGWLTGELQTDAEWREAIDLDGEAAETALREWLDDKASTGFARRPAALRIAHAALGDTEDG